MEPDEKMSGDADEARTLQAAPSDEGASGSDEGEQRPNQADWLRQAH